MALMKELESAEQQLEQDSKSNPELAACQAELSRKSNAVTDTLQRATLKMTASAHTLPMAVIQARTPAAAQKLIDANLAAAAQIASEIEDEIRAILMGGSSEVRAKLKA
jgi:hypothetical protein